MKKIKAYIGWNDTNHTHYYKEFEIVEKLPEKKKDVFDKNGERIVKIESVKLDCEQGNDDVYNYDYYVAKIEYDYGLTTEWYFCIKKEEYFTVTIEFKSYPANQAYYLTHDIFYSNFDISESFQDDCLFDIKELEMVKNYLKKDSASCDYNYKINLED